METVGRWALALMVVGGCQTNEVVDATFHGDVGVLFSARCVSCHTEGGIGPFALDDAETAATWAEAAANAVEARTMPPWLVTGDGTCGEFADNEWLTDDEIALVRQWADDGAPSGTGTNDLVATPRAVLDGTTETLAMEAFTPEIVGGDLAEFDEYRCFLLENTSGSDRFMTGYDVVPGNDAIVHHVLAFTVDQSAASYVTGKTNGEVIAEHQADEPTRDGWPCFAEAGDGVNVDSQPVSWAPGQGAVNFPDGVGIRLREDQDLVMQVHYNLANPDTLGQSDATSLQIETATSVEREGFIFLFDEFLNSIFGFGGEEIPPGETSWSYNFRIDGSEPLDTLGVNFNVVPSYEILGVMPHMHERGVTFQVDHVQNGERSCVARVDNWDFNWQRVYMYDSPIEVTAGDAFRVECTWNTSADTEAVLPGWGTRNEMCLVGLLGAATMP